MVKSKNTVYIFSCFVFLLLLLTLSSFLLGTSPPSIDTVWVINLDKDTERLAHVKKQQHLLPKPIQRWKASYGKEENRVEISKEGVSDLISKSSVVSENEKSDKVLNNPGDIGCWLSHKRLLTHLSNQGYPKNTAHLICEDDIIIDKKFQEKWDIVSKNIPNDWEVIYLGIRRMNADYVNTGVYRWKFTDDNVKRNLGTHAYIIKQSATPKLVERLRLMSGQIDTQFYKTLTGMNVYVLNPILIDSSEELESSIDEQQKRHYDTK